jgi:5-methyltetrahydropteroyltriglutamate--homocysteine methyltransferase
MRIDRERPTTADRYALPSPVDRPGALHGHGMPCPDASVLASLAMQILLANHSSYPGAHGDGELDRVLADQTSAGLDLLTDGQLGWSDTITAPLAALAGVRLGAPASLPGVPDPFRRPLITAKLRRYVPLCVDAYRRAAARTPRGVKVAIPGPHTLAHCASIATTAYAGPDALADDLATILAQEVAALVAAGAPAIQIDEPLILSRPGDIRRLRELLEPIYDAAGGRTLMIVSSYGGDATDLYAQLNTLPADVIAIDCAGRPKLCEIVAETGSGKVLGLGIVAGRSAAPEDPSAVARACEQMLRRYVHDRVWLQPSCGLGHLSAAQARAKLHALMSARIALDY